jgi:hypothetical protein
MPRMGLVRKAAYYTLGDGRLDRSEGGYRTAGKRVVKAKSELKAADAALVVARRLTDVAFEAIRAAAEAEIGRRQREAAAARQELARLDAAVHRQSRGFRPRL